MSGGGTPPDAARRRPERPSRPWPARVRPSDELAERLNREWRLFGSGPTLSLKQRLTSPLRLALAVVLAPQRAFNATVVQHLNHLHEVNDLAAHALRGTLDDVFERTDVLFDRIEQLESRFSELDAVLDDSYRLQQLFGATERRVTDAVAAMREEHAQIRTAIGVLRHETQQLSKGLAGRATAAAGDTAVAASGPQRSTDALTHKYIGFEDEFRGSAAAVRAGLAAYVPLFAGARDVLDVGCGRGEFLSLLRDSGVSARGIDLNDVMVDVCREKGLAATVADALAYLRDQPDASLGGLFAAQVVEHLQPGYLTQLLEVAFAKLRPGALIVLETINPACWFAFFSSYIRDITHERPLHPDTLKYLLVATGFQQVEIRYSAPYPAHDKLQPIGGAGLPIDTANTLNANAEKLNHLLFTHLDYAAIGRHP